MAFQFPYRIHHQHRESEDSEIPHNIIASPNAYNRSWVCVLGGWGALWSRMSKTPWWYPQAVPAFASWVLLSLMSREEPFLSHFNRCTVGPEVNGLSFLFFPFFLFPPPRLVQFSASNSLLVNRLMPWRWVGVSVGGGGGRRDGRRGESINRTEAGNDELREQPLIFHFDRLSSVRRQRRWLLCPEKRHLLFVMQASAFFFFF